jgi:hypothetical protein
MEGELFFVNSRGMCLGACSASWHKGDNILMTLQQVSVYSWSLIDRWKNQLCINASSGEQNCKNGD